MADNTAESDLLLEEFRQAWTHYRHLETIRSWYVGVFLTFTGVAVSFLAKSLDPPTPRNHFITIIIITFICHFGLAVIGSLSNIKVGMYRYIKAYNNIRNIIYNDKYEKIVKNIHIFNDEAVKISRSVRVDTTALPLIWFIVIIFFLYLFFVGVRLTLWGEPSVNGKSILEGWRWFAFLIMWFFFVLYTLSVAFRVKCYAVATRARTVEPAQEVEFLEVLGIVINVYRKKILLFRIISSSINNSSFIKYISNSSFIKYISNSSFIKYISNSSFIKYINNAYLKLSRRYMVRLFIPRRLLRLRNTSDSDNPKQD